MPYTQLAQTLAIQRLREEKGMNLRDLAAGVHMNFSTIARRLKVLDEDGKPLPVGERPKPFTGGELTNLLKVMGVSNTRFQRLADEIRDDLQMQSRPNLIPVIGTVPAGGVSIHWQTDDPKHAEEHLDAGDLMNRNAVAMKVVGESMQPLLPPGSYVICLPIPNDADRLPFEHNDMVVVSFSDDSPTPGTTIGYWHVRPDKTIQIRKENHIEYDPIPVDMEHLVSALAVVEWRRPTRFANYRIRTPGRLPKL